MTDGAAGSSAFHDVLAANRAFAAAFDRGTLERPPRRRLAIVTCMDARIDPLSAFGLEPGDVAVLRNAGAIVTDDVLRSLVVAQALLGVERALVVGHTECGLEGDAGRIAEQIGAGAEALDPLAFASVAESVRAGVRRIRESGLLPDGFEAAGVVYDVRSGRVLEVEEHGASLD